MRTHRGVIALIALVALVALGPATEAVAIWRASYVLPPPDPVLQARLLSVLNESPYRRLISERRLSVALVDVTDMDRVRYAGYDADRMRYAASLPKIGILLGVFDQVDRGRLAYTPTLRRRLELMIRNSDNRISSELIRTVGFQNIARALQDPRHELYDRNRRGGLWVGRGYGSGVGLWRRDPLGNTSHGATARQAARFFVLLERGELVSPWSSAEMKSILGDPALRHKFVLGLEESHPNALVYRKSGSWQNYHADAALVEHDGRKYVAAALLESPSTSSQGVLASLIVRLDDLVFESPGAAAEALARQ